MTTAALALMTFLVFLLRIFWLRMPSVTRFYLSRVAVALIILHLIFTATSWGTSSDHLNIILKWLAIASYEMLLMLFTLLPPRWLTSICVVVLLVPVFSSAIVLPLTPIFNAATYTLKPLGSNLFSQNLPWGEGVAVNSGTTVTIYYRPPFAPFLRHNVLAFPFNNQECDTKFSFAVLQPDGKHVLARCPHWPTQSPGTDDRLFPVHYP